MNPLYRLEIFVTGKRIQKAGFRSAVEEAAADANVTGKVENVQDKDKSGRLIKKVRVIGEGSENELKNFIEKLNLINGFHEVDKIPVDVLHSKKEIENREFEEFVIVRKEHELAERFDEAAFYMKGMKTEMSGMRKDMQEMSSDMKGMSNDMKEMSTDTKSMNEKMGEMSSDMKETNSSMKEFRTETKENFETMNNKYHTISENLSLMTNLLAEYLKRKEPDLKDVIESLQTRFKERTS